MNFILDDPELQRLLDPGQLKALERMRNAALRTACRTHSDSLAMTAANLLPLFIKERGVEWARREVERILVLIAGATDSKRAFRRATKEFLDLL